MLKRFEFDMLIKAVVAIGVILLVGLTLPLLLVRQQSALIPVVVTTLLGLLATVVWHCFPRKS